jgi:tRNA(Ile)-lysidine synthase
MNDALKKYIDQHNLFKPEDKILLAVSGGIDSMVMADLFSRGFHHIAFAHCNFGLRGHESDGDDAFVREMAEKYGVPLFVVRFDETDFRKLEGFSTQMAARKLRYDWFEDVRSQNGYDAIATAHHLDDQVETFFINLSRGTGIAGLHGIQPRLGYVIRPMLFATRGDIEAYAKENHIVYRDDSSNASMKYLRNMIRHELIPVLKKINPDITTAIAGTIHRIGGYEKIGNKVLQQEIAKIRTENGSQVRISIAGLKNLTPIDLYAWELLSPFGFGNATITNIVESLQHHSGKRFYSSTHRLIRDREHLIVEPLKDAVPPPASGKGEKTGSKHPMQHADAMIFIDQETEKIDTPVQLLFHTVDRTPAFIISTDPSHASIDLDKLTFPLTLRKWRPGDAFFPLGMTKRQKLSDFFINAKIPLTEKENIRVLCSDRKIIWIVGYRIDHRFRVTPETRYIFSATVTR